MLRFVSTQTQSNRESLRLASIQFSEAISALSKDPNLKNSFPKCIDWCIKELFTHADNEEKCQQIKTATEVFLTPVFVDQDQKIKSEEKDPEALWIYLLYKIRISTLENRLPNDLSTLVINSWMLSVDKVYDTDVEMCLPVHREQSFHSEILPSPNSFRSDRVVFKPLSESFNETGDIIGIENTGISLESEYRKSDFVQGHIPVSKKPAQYINANFFFPKEVFPSLPVNPFVEIAQKNTEAFAKKYGLYADIFPKFQEMKFAWLCGFAYATSSFLYTEDRLCIVADWITSLFSHNDAIDGLETPNHEQAVSKLSAINDRLLAIVNTPLHEIDLVDILAISPREKAMADVYKRLTQYTLEDENLIPFRRTFEDYLRATEWECRNRELNIIPRFKEYQWRRRDTGAAYNAFALGLILIGTPKLMNNTIVQTLADRVCDSIGVINDMYSYWKEATHPNVYENAVKLRMTEQHLSLETAFLECEKTHRESVIGIKESCNALEHILPTIAPPDNILEAEEGLLFITNWALANLHWSNGTGRYALDSKSQLSR